MQVFLSAQSSGYDCRMALEKRKWLRDWRGECELSLRRRYDKWRCSMSVASADLCMDARR